MEVDEEEVWVAVPGWEGEYEVSNLGRVRSLDRDSLRSDGKVNRLKGRVLALNRQPRAWGGSYANVGLSRGTGTGQYVWRPRVHVLVALAFHGPKPNGTEVRHLNGDGLDNRAVNLAWGTPSQNRDDTRRLGRQRKEWKTHCSRGHEYTEENTNRNACGYRVCRQCQQINWKISNDKRSEQRRRLREEGKAA